MSYLIRVDGLKNKLQNKHDDRVVIVDVRFDLSDPNAGRAAYEQGHITGAVYLDLNKDLSGQVQKHGGKHPLPDVDTFAEKIGNCGIDQKTTVIVYDQNNDMFAARLWWLLEYMGHEKTYLLDGGFDRWVEQGNKVETSIPIVEKRHFKPNVKNDRVVSIERIRENLQSKEAILIDSRAKERYLGKVEPLYSKAGHIPGAKNFFWKDVLREDGSWKTKEELNDRFAGLSKDAEIIVSCGSGVSACPNIFALKRAGFNRVKLYPGSFSDWISYDENKIETKEE
ncbi:thiosulfate/3-mercaptopyruvate sulfurtransferase [Oceanobacillus limi]|uniref:Thiosulfate/3-mercaptopyruvate sulfurtransferase n=1 Tax=Oceanobacillus limi TaxID=930131 RepID=A0A1I0AZS2_9BACI|nr:sulfurtransferase [Oceanobacillus limi]SES99295.1 thiosulfate/3-mercaptopyruvate sulfurtransferase [Oceanobacillus limi]